MQIIYEHLYKQIAEFWFEILNEYCYFILGVKNSHVVPEISIVIAYKYTTFLFILNVLKDRVR